MSKYEWKNKWTHLIRRCSNSIGTKKKAGHSLDIGAGFIMEDISSVQMTENKKIIITFLSNADMVIESMSELNLRECCELRKYCKLQEIEETKKEIENDSETMQ